MSSSVDFVCPDAQYHGNPFRYCPVKGCGWMEKRPPVDAKLPPADLVADVRVWVNVYPDGGYSCNHSAGEARAYALNDRIWLVHPDGRWQKCNGREVIGEPVEVPR